MGAIKSFTITQQGKSTTDFAGTNIPATTLTGSGSGATFDITTQLVLEITPSSGANGSISPNTKQDVDQGSDSVTFTFTPDAGYRIDQVLIDGVNNASAVTAGSYQFTNVQTDHTIAVSFVLNNLNITASSGANGSITPSGNVSVAYGANQRFDFTPSAGYHINQVLVDGTNVPSAVTNGYYIFTNVTTAHTISVSFAIDTFTIVASGSGHGDIDPMGNVSVNYGANQQFTFTPETGYKINDVIVDGLSVPSAVTAGSYTFSNVTAGHTITVTFVRQTFTIAVTQAANGTISPGTNTYDYGDNQTFTITPNTNYHVQSLVVDGSIIAPSTSHTFTNITANHTITAVFAIDTFQVTVTQGTNGTISPGTTSYNYGESPTFTITPDTNYHIDQVLIDGTPNAQAKTDGYYTFSNINTTHTISATYAINTFTIVAGAAPTLGGSISPSGNVSVNATANQRFDFTPTANYQIDRIEVDGVVNAQAKTDGYYIFTNVLANHTIDAYFIKKTFTITASAGAQGSISPSGVVTVDADDDQAFTFSVDTAHYHISQVLIDGVNNPSAITAGSYTFTNVQANHTIAVNFAIDTYPITPSAGSNGSISPNTVQNVAHEANQRFDFTPSAHYHISEVLVDGINDPSAVSAGFYVFTNVTASHTISANFAIDTFDVTVTQTNGGTISPSSSNYNYGASPTFTITPDTNYQIDDVIVDGISLGVKTSHTFNNISANHTITAVFAIDTYTITPSIEGNGTITPNTPQQVEATDSVDFTYSPATNNKIKDVLIDGISSSQAITDGHYNFTNVLADHTIKVVFYRPKLTYQVMGAGADETTVNVTGDVEPNGDLILGGTVNVDITIGEEYELNHVSINGVVHHDLEYEFTDVQDNIEILIYVTHRGYLVDLNKKKAGCEVTLFSKTLTTDTKITFSDKPANKIFLLKLVQDENGYHEFSITNDNVFNISTKDLSEINKEPNSITKIQFVLETLPNGDRVFSYWIVDEEKLPVFTIEHTNGTVYNVDDANAFVDNNSVSASNPIYVTADQSVSIPRANVRKVTITGVAFNLKTNFLRYGFRNCTNLIDVTFENVTINRNGVTDASGYLYYCFQNCPSLITAPEIPALPSGVTTTGSYLVYCFGGCTSLTTVPVIPVLPSGVTNASGYLRYTFYSCSSLATAPTIPALPSGVTNASNYLDSCFYNCSTLATAPVIPALASGVINASAYLFSCFQGCVSLSSAPTIPVLPNGVTNADSYLASCFHNTSITTVPVIPALPSGVTSAISYLDSCFYNTPITTAPIIPGLPSSVTSANSYLYCTFYDCTLLTNALIANIPPFTGAGIATLPTNCTTSYAGGTCPALPDTPIATLAAFQAGYNYH